MGKKVPQKTILAIIIIMLMSITLSVSSLAWVGYPDTGYEETYQMCIAEEKTTGNIYAVRIYQEGLNEEYKWLSVGQNDRIEAWAPKSGGSGIQGLSLRLNKWLPDLQEWGQTENREFYFKEILQSNVNIYSDAYKTSVFFSPPKLILPPVLTQHQPLTLMTPQIRGISPFLIGLLVALVAFWKACQFLFKTLRKA